MIRFDALELRITIDCFAIQRLEVVYSKKHWTSSGRIRVVSTVRPVHSLCLPRHFVENRVKDSWRESFVARSELDQLRKLSPTGEFLVALSKRSRNLDLFHRRSVDLLEAA